MYKLREGEPYYSNRHSCFLLQYHIVLVTKYRHPVLAGGVKDMLYSMINDMASERGLNVLELNGEADHVHILLEADPYTCMGEFINALKTRTSRMIRKAYGATDLKKWYWKPYFWANSYFVATVSEQSLSAVRHYIQSQKG